MLHKQQLQSNKKKTWYLPLTTKMIYSQTI